jgi:hypothetical protein
VNLGEKKENEKNERNNKPEMEKNVIYFGNSVSMAAYMQNLKAVHSGISP